MDGHGGRKITIRNLKVRAGLAVKSEVNGLSLPAITPAPPSYALTLGRVE